MRKLYAIGIIGITLLGMVHIVLGFRVYPDFSTVFFWFTGTGLALIFTGIANYMNKEVKTTLTYVCSLIINGFLFVFATILAVKHIHLPAMLVAFCAFLLLISPGKSPNRRKTFHEIGPDTTK